MSERPDFHAADGMVGEHGKPDDHGGDHGQGDLAHGGEALGPVDVPSWGAALVGMALGLAVVLAFVWAVS